jgi:hypothetical protein
VERTRCRLQRVSSFSRQEDALTTARFGTRLDFSRNAPLTGLPGILPLRFQLLSECAAKHRERNLTNVDTEDSTVLQYDNKRLPGFAT